MLTKQKRESVLERLEREAQEAKTREEENRRKRNEILQQLKEIQAELHSGSVSRGRRLEIDDIVPRLRAEYGPLEAAANQLGPASNKAAHALWMARRRLKVARDNLAVLDNPPGYVDLDRNYSPAQRKKIREQSLATIKELEGRK